jgi:putative phosphoesterase
MSAVPARSVDVVVFGGTHREMVAHYEGVLFVNPGSPTLPARPRDGGLGTLAILEIRNSMATVEIIHLKDG